ncbi:helix-turn-helix transcriptional regulator [Pararhodobacter sp. SW119]|uniref:helix-turn-helix transcriptional regulator n=1 Tax=Pararhodobacter sp. SW119 TaxID=2780075 RepID=UPI001ADF1CBF|nr:helix-turn-helix transcriptional regulator [Pararhodobacter sp. SW119]
MIYDCALDPGRWSDTLDHIRTELNFANAAISFMDMHTGQMPLSVIRGPEPEWIARIPQFGSDMIDMWGGLDKMRALPIHEPAVQSRVLDPTNWPSNRYFMEWARPQGLHDALIIILSNDKDMLGSVGFGRHESQGEIGRLEIDAARLLIPHFQRAAAIGRLLDIKSIVSSTFDATLDTLSVAVTLVDVNLRIVLANSAARTLLASEGAIRSRHGILRISPAEVEAALIVAVRRAAEDEAGAGRRGFGIPASHNGGAPCVLHVLPLRHGRLRPGLMPSAAAAVFIARASDATRFPTDILAALYDLTPAEARVFESIASGSTRAEAAEALGLGRSTVKSHLAQIFAKTGARRQADLVALAAALALPLQT